MCSQIFCVMLKMHGYHFFFQKRYSKRAVYNSPGIKPMIKPRNFRKLHKYRATTVNV